MPRRKQQSTKNRRRKTAAVKKCRAEYANPNPSSTPDSHRPSPHSSLGSDEGPVSSLNNKRPMPPMVSVDGAADHIRSKKIRRRSSHHSHPSAVLIPTTPLPLAVYQPASLFAILLVASLLPKNTFSLRWLATDPQMGTRGGRKCLVNNGCRLFAEQNDKMSSSLLAMALDPEGGESGSETPMEEMSLRNRKVITALWNGATAALERTMSASITTSSLSKDDESQGWSIDSLLDTIPRGGDFESDEETTYAGLVNLGNTCYLNAQLQCAYHVPYLRQLILDARDEVVDVEFEVEVEVEEDEEEEDQVEGGDEVEVENLAPDCDDMEGTETESIEAENAQESENGPELQGDDDDDDDDVVSPPKKKTILKKEIKQELVPISDALRALQHTFNSLRRSSSSGSTNVLCRALGINPYLQQDGQEFWKLFIPEVDNSEVSQLYSGYFEDYVREIVPEDSDEEEELVAEDYDEEEKKDDEGENNALKEHAREARERVRTEPFLDLSIPVAEGTGGSVESTLKEMFTEPEILRCSEGNGWRPSKGAEKVDAYKGSSLKREGLPSLLQLHLKRFKYDWDTGETSKINDCCSFPLELDLSEISETDGETGDQAESDAIYDLQSIVIHAGEYGSGHYYSYVRPDIRRNEWLRFDDDIVTPVEYSDVVADAYGGSRRRRRKRSRSDSFESTAVTTPVKRRRGLFRRIFSMFGGLFRRATMIGSSSSSVGGCGFGYGGRASSAYMLQYARRSDMPKLYLEDHEQ